MQTASETTEMVNIATRGDTSDRPVEPKGRGGADVEDRANFIGLVLGCIEAKFFFGRLK